MSNSKPKINVLDPASRAREIELISESLRDLRYGSVTIVVQDGVIVQIDRTEKRRIRIATTT